MISNAWNADLLKKDLTVQQIKNEFTARVYEENIRICLESDDINYFNQCQSQLMDLYKHNISSENRCVLDSYG